MGNIVTVNANLKALQKFRAAAKHCFDGIWTRGVPGYAILSYRGKNSQPECWRTAVKVVSWSKAGKA